MRENENAIDLVGATTDVVAAYVSKNSIPVSELRPLVHAVYAALKRVTESHPVAPSDPAVPVEGSVTADYIVCLEDGRKFKSLKRHLRSKYNMSPEQYRAKWNLPADYPMVAPNYAKTRSDLAKAIGLGRPDTLRDAA
ncbi:MucR family transcriptional regulator [Methylobacterium pseudosasicola]|uniref:Transcriptional regulator, MucR family n=1 Tax=Methylobacterium pseudosasicola TaxID=582667 RepID=A0A1I4GQF5_9HYPH|nr:MucR family transcriptional regulator [Methylobacterium pseudosasicola]SFL31740.1 transcriptional regulator, MucR family [Methylobacterium pseudosasicola]